MSAQLSFDEITPADQLLSDVTFVVVDLETTGTDRTGDAITEIGAVKIRGGEVLGEFTTLVNPGRDIPPSIVAITGITNEMVADAPPLDSVLPAFLEFSRGAVLVAHNAPFDIGFLRANCERLGLPWPKPQVVDTVRLAKRVITKDETPNYRLATLAQVLHAGTEPVHRALDDARTTVDVLHTLLERIGNLGVQTLGDLQTHLAGVTAAQRSKRALADGLPDSPGVYLFRGPNDEVLYVGTATSLRKRVRQYFTAGERRARIKEMVALCERIDHVVCAHPLEAEVRELRLLTAHQPRYNRRSKFPQRSWWVALTEEPFPRLSVVRKPPADALGPFSSRRAAAEAVETLQSAVPIRRCTERIPAENQRGRPCALHELGHCGAPCAGLESRTEYAKKVIELRSALNGHSGTLLDRLRAELDRLSAAHRFEEAAAHRDRLAQLVQALDRGQRLAALASIPEMTAARPDGHGGWQLAVIRYGKLAAASTAPRGVPPLPAANELRTGAENVIPGPGPLRGSTADETTVLSRWLTSGETCLVNCVEPWAEPARSAGSWREWAKQASSARQPYGAAN